MAQKRAPATSAEASAAGGEDLSTAVQALTQAAQALATTASQMMEMIGALRSGTKGGPEAPGGPAVGAPAVQISIWEDDPFSEATPTPHPAPGNTTTVTASVNNHALLQTQVVEPGPPPAIYAPATPSFRYWNASEALARGINFWASLLPPQTRWTTTSLPMRVTLVAGQDLNANYTRTLGLRFYQRTVRNIPIFSAESPDVVCHELGHAILDAVRPQLFNVASLEAAAFHESFGDMSALLSALQLPTLRQKVLQETQGHLNVNSRLSRLAEQLGWGIRQLSPTAVDPDCLRNAANRFFYRPPIELPPTAPANELSSESHAFSRVFTGAFLDALARMVTIAGASNDSANLLAVSNTLGQLLIDGVRLAPITSNYYSQVAAAMIQADLTRNGGRFRGALSSAFIQHGILSPSAAAALAESQAPHMIAAQATEEAGAQGTVAYGRSGDALGASRMLLSFGGEEDEGYRRGAEDAPEMPTQVLETEFGLALHVHLAEAPERVAFAPAAFEVGAAEVASPEQDAHAFVEDLMQLGRVDCESARGLVPAELVPIEEKTRLRKTHVLIPTPDGQVVLKRLHFDCGLGGCSCCR